MRWKRSLTLSAAVMLASLVAYGPIAAAEKVVTIVRVNDTERYDPHTTTTRSTADVAFMLGDTLVTLDYDMTTIQPGLAKSWEMSPDGLVYTFHLRDDVSYCSGKKLTAHDVAASFKRWLDPKTGGVTKSKAGEVDTITAKDDYTLEYRLKRPHSELLLQMTQHVFTVINVEEANAQGADFGTKGFDGTGPFCFESWEPRNQTVLVKHDGYNWGSPQFTYQSPQVDKIIWKIGPEESTRVASVRTGQIDLMQHVPYWALDQLLKDPNLYASQAKAYFWTGYIGFKISRPFLKDLRVRQAINLAVDAEGISDAVYFGHADAANSYIKPGVLDYDDGMELSQFSYDPAQAKQLLAEAGWQPGSGGVLEKDGQKLELVAYAFTLPIPRQIIEAIQGDLRKVGITLKIELFDPTVIWGKLKTPDFDLYTMTYPYMSTADALNLYWPSINRPAPNRMDWNDPEETDAWLKNAGAALTDEERRMWLSKTQRKIHDATVWIPIAHEPLFIFANKRKLKPVRAHGIYGAGLYKGLEIAFK